MAEIALQRIDYCRGYDEVELKVRAVEGRSLSAPGVVLDAGVLAAGLVGSLIVPQPAVKGAIVLGAAVPLAADGIATLDKTEKAPEMRVEKRYVDVGAAPCSTRRAADATVVFEGRAFAAEGDVFRIEIAEGYLMAHGSTDAVNVAITVTAGGAPNQPLGLRLAPGADYQTYAAARMEVERFGTPLRIARFVSAYPASAVNEGLRLALVRMLPAVHNADELQSVLSLEGLDGDVRKAVRARFTELRTEGLMAAIPEKLTLAVEAERSANTFLLNGFAEEGRARLAEKERYLAEACRSFAELAVRDGRPRRELWTAIEAALPPQAAAALVWLKACP
jgi:hypothetical protein